VSIGPVSAVSGGQAAEIACFSGLQVHGSNSCSPEAGWSPMRRRTSASRARGSTSFGRAVTMREYIAAARSPPFRNPGGPHVPVEIGWGGCSLPMASISKDS
jgi:hypothetical protein